MKIKELIDKQDILDICDESLMEMDAVPTASTGEITDTSLLFIPKKVADKEFVSPFFKDRKPLVAVIGPEAKGQAFDFPTITVKNPRKAMSIAFAKHLKIDFSRITFVGITGTCGKTTTASILQRILWDAGYSVGFIGTGKIMIGNDDVTVENYSMTTPDPSYLYRVIKSMQDSGCTHVVMEVSSHSIAQERIAPIPFEYGIFTNLSQEHLDYHQGMEDYFETKLKFVKRCKRAVFNIDDPYSKRAMNECGYGKTAVGVINRADVYATDTVSKGLHGSDYIYHKDGLSFKVSLSLPGAYNVYNSLMALTAAIELGVKPCVAKISVNTISGIPGRMEILDGSITAIIDYAHTPESLLNTLKTINSSINPRQRVTVVFGCGGNRDKEKRPLMGEIAYNNSHRVIITEDNNRDEDFYAIADDITKNLPDEDVCIIKDRKSAIREAILNAEDGDVVAFIGKGHEKYILSKGEYKPFDEKEIILTALIERDSLCE